MNTISKRLCIGLSALMLFGCQSSNPELNRCGQELFQCQQNCDMRSSGDGLVKSVCETKCTESHNRCKSQAEALINVQ
ncbi:hypothetical protein [Pseudoalteromonas tunicata]|uniref:Putative orphan protein n=1 Tax=Pseudoalteromonas tunicata D2 TaxID=87626 RepID=A4C750_9GAMM|nr:hypothetical protein [Pseudoalteromonas tunicata]ATC95775.1 hypothetical protein PTUN_a3446 [Pseudoalteromonas tunicata]AXT31323.1 hypothetical protein D1819_11210 [Pseudoalteromonas tunicata]EAR29804.1 putative orphan protein [Pseudoalteromonas tunicata D2]MDP4985280.1 hypothetical protein [Pseudoalteromonas tunicata]MDP5214039.1 hypothetical protein [Pseudoalteromonas tunicata]